MKTLNNWPCGHSHPELEGRFFLGQAQPAPGVCCQKDPAGNTVCSDGLIYPPGCPKAPAINVQGVAQYYNDGGILRPTPPAPGSCGAAAAAPPVPAAAPAAPSAAVGGKNTVWPWLGLVGAGALAYFLLDQ